MCMSLFQDNELLETWAFAYLFWLSRWYTWKWTNIFFLPEGYIKKDTTHTKWINAENQRGHMDINIITDISMRFGETESRGKCVSQRVEQNLLWKGSCLWEMRVDFPIRPLKWLWALRLYRGRKWQVGLEKSNNLRVSIWDGCAK